MNSPERRSDASGPAPAICTSSLGVSGSRPMRETPPNRKRVIPSTGRPFMRATSEWESSCSSTDTNSSRAASPPRRDRAGKESWGSHVRKRPPALQATRKKMMSQEASMLMGMPATENSCRPRLRRGGDGWRPGGRFTSRWPGSGIPPLGALPRFVPHSLGAQGGREARVRVVIAGNAAQDALAVQHCVPPGRRGGAAQQTGEGQA